MQRICLFSSWVLYFFADLFKLVKERLMFEVVRNIVIKSGNDFVDLLLPTGIHILTQLYGLEKFSKRLLIDPSKAAGYLRKLRKHGSQFLCFYFISIFYLSNLHGWLLPVATPALPIYLAAPLECNYADIVRNHLRLPHFGAALLFGAIHK